MFSISATAAKENMLPYFPRLIEALKVYLVKTDNEDLIQLRPTAIDTLASLARTIGRDNFLPLATDTMNLGLTLIDGSTDPDLRRSCYNLFSAMGEVLKTDIASALPKIVESMIISVKSTEGIQPDFDDNEDALNGVDDEDIDEDPSKEYDIENTDGEEDDDDDDVGAYSVENAYMDEKEEAVVALKELAENTGAEFAPYIQTSFEEVYKLISYPSEDIRKVSIEALTQFILSLYEMKNADGVRQCLLVLIPKYSEIIRTGMNFYNLIYILILLFISLINYR